jgi:hypothetical protein
VLNNPVWVRPKQVLGSKFYGRSDPPFSQETSPANIDGSEAYNDGAPLTPI